MYIIIIICVVRVAPAAAFVARDREPGAHIPVRRSRYVHQRRFTPLGLWWVGSRGQPRHDVWCLFSPSTDPATVGRLAVTNGPDKHRRYIYVILYYNDDDDDDYNGPSLSSYLFFSFSSQLNHFCVHIHDVLRGGLCRFSRHYIML